MLLSSWPCGGSESACERERRLDQRSVVGEQPGDTRQFAEGLTQPSAEPGGIAVQTCQCFPSAARPRFGEVGEVGLLARRGLNHYRVQSTDLRRDGNCESSGHGGNRPHDCWPAAAELRHQPDRCGNIAPPR